MFYLSIYPEITMCVRKRNGSPCLSLVLRLMVKRERERGGRKDPPSLVVGGGLYRVRHPLTSYVTKRGINAIMPAHNKTVMLTIGLRISE